MMTRPAHQISLTIPVIETERLVLREPRETDFPAMLAFNDSPRAGFVGGGRDRRWIWRGLLANIGLWVLRGHGFYSVDTRAGDFVGRVGVLFHDGWEEPELGWHLFDGFEGQGYAAEAALAAKADYHARHTAKPLISYIDPKNVKSQAVAKRLGARPEREALFFDTPTTVWRHTGPEARA
jgi:RimJ/RimL family protein N-acetyltransferase